MSIIGEALLSAAINALFDKLASTDLLQFARQEQIHSDLKKWEKILRQAYKVLDDAEEKQITDRFVKDWLDDLRNLAYDVEDILDEFVTEALRRKLVDEPQPQASTRSKVRKLIPTCCISLNPESIKFNVKMGSEIKEITDRLEKIVEQKNNLDLKDNLGGKSYKVGYRRLPATSLNETHICGRENDKEAILDMLFKDEGTSSGGVAVSVISIIGMGGLGKTTLAQLVYNDVLISKHGLIFRMILILRE
ncbi:hypothetical protein Dsin_000751 [Dipteronia sinensis]|uniref:Disease resistance RPP13-like protein 1 n=1 Tax=Dipteronia sinensis TaxID=43782 RepID=A0AAE0B3X6_9ROSI|nr:hypothetical protein Dsin_000751 [Dipteronia sinensis]